MATGGDGAVATPLDYTNRGGTLVGVCIVAIVITSIVVPLRFYVRVAVVKSVGWDDWMALVAAVSMAAHLTFHRQFINLLTGFRTFFPCGYDYGCEKWDRSPYERRCVS